MSPAGSTAAATTPVAAAGSGGGGVRGGARGGTRGKQTRPRRPVSALCLLDEEYTDGDEGDSSDEDYEGDSEAEEDEEDEDIEEDDEEEEEETEDAGVVDTPRPLAVRASRAGSAAALPARKRARSAAAAADDDDTDAAADVGPGRRGGGRGSPGVLVSRGSLRSAGVCVPAARRPAAATFGSPARAAQTRRSMRAAPTRVKTKVALTSAFRPPAAGARAR